MALEAGDHVWYYDGAGNEYAIDGEQTSLAQNVPRSTWFPGAKANDPNDYRDNGLHIFNFVYYGDDEIRRGQPHMRHRPGSFAWLDNNPGNITTSGGGLDLGQFPGKANWHSFVIFPDHDTGFDAIAILLGTPAYQQRTILQAFQKWAPAGDGGNTPAVYAADVAHAAHTTVRTRLGDLDEDQLLLVQKKIELIEGSVAGDVLSADDVPWPISDLIQA